MAPRTLPSPYWKPDYQQPTVVCSSGSPSGRPLKSNSGATPAPAVRQPHLPNDSELLHCGERFCSYWNVRRCWEALPLTREGS